MPATRHYLIKLKSGESGKVTVNLENNMIVGFTPSLPYMIDKSWLDVLKEVTDFEEHIDYGSGMERHKGRNLAERGN